METDDVGPKPNFQYRPITGDNLADLLRFSREHGKFRYCSCMRWRMTSSEYRRSTKEERIAALEDGVQAGKPTGVLAYTDDLPVGWCSVAPRFFYEGLERYRALPRLDEEPTWAVVCFFVDSRYRRFGMTRGLLNAAVAYAGSQGARIVEGYPVEPGAKSYTYMGSPATFLSAGFQDVTPAGQKRPVFRYYFD